MTGVITTGNFPKALWPGVKSWFGAAYEDHKTEYTDLFEVDTSDRNYEELVQERGFGLAPVKNQGAPISYDSTQQGFVSRFTHVAYSLGFIVTYEEFKDNLYEKVGKRRSGSLARSMRQTRENVGANIYNRAYNTSFTGGDGKALIVSDHPTLAGNQSNVLAVAADLSEVAIEDLIIQIMQATDDRGLKIALKPKSLHIAPNNAFNATRILKSTLQNDTANNAVNAIRAMGLLPEGAKVNHYFTDPDAWFIRTDAKDGLIHFERDIQDIAMDNDFDTKNGKYAKYERYSFGWADWRALFGSPGA